ncbi:hypothetical protein GWI33_000651, partial [Rhynchophorus ferrugineus]
FNELLDDNVRLVYDPNRNNMADASAKFSAKPDRNLARTDRNLLKHGFPKILCLKKASLSNNDGKPERNTLKSLNVNSLESLNSNRSCDSFKTGKSASKTSLDIKNENLPNEKSRKEDNYSNGYTEKQKNRNSFHQNVDEALSSLLWQPYEYQNNNYSYNENGNYEESYSTWYV